MENQPTNTLPLYFLFDDLRKNDYPLGIGDYQRFVLALEQNMGLSLTGYQIFLNALNSQNALTSLDTMFLKENLFRLCKLLWFKPGKSLPLFEDLFEKAYRNDFTQVDSTTSISTPRPWEREPESNKAQQPPQQPGHKSDQPVDQISMQTGDAKTEFSVRIGLQNRKPDSSDKFTTTTGAAQTDTSFLFIRDYYPIDKRNIHQTFRSFPVFQTARRSSQVDINGTIEKTVSIGYFNGFVLEKEKQNSSALLFLIDNSDNMVAFNPLSDMLRIEFAKVLGGKNKNQRSMHTFYFHNPANEFFFKNSAHTDFVRADEFLKSIASLRFSVIIISDAGAASGSRNPEKVRLIQSLLDRLYKYTSKAAWLNPLPRERWKSNTAEVIATKIAMFEATENGIKNAVSFLKGSTPQIIEKNGNN